MTIGFLSIVKLSEESTFSSCNNKDKDKSKNINILYSINASNISKSLHYFSSKNLRTLKNFDEFSPVNKAKQDNLKNPLFKKLQVNPLHIDYKKINLRNVADIGNEEEICKKDTKNETSKNLPVLKDNTAMYIRKIDKRKILNKKNINKNLICEQYEQDFQCLKYMRKIPPKMPEIYEHVYKFKNNNTLFKDNESLGILNKGNIPNVFFDHLFANRKNKLNKCKYNKTSTTHRNKKKLITIIYYSP